MEGQIKWLYALFVILILASVWTIALVICGHVFASIMVNIPFLVDLIPDFNTVAEINPSDTLNPSSASLLVSQLKVGLYYSSFILLVQVPIAVLLLSKRQKGKNLRLNSIKGLKSLGLFTLYWNILDHLEKVVNALQTNFVTVNGWILGLIIWFVCFLLIEIVLSKWIERNFLLTLYLALPGGYIVYTKRLIEES
jgi:hypothetical protein